jgi:hypothetical protein
MSLKQRARNAALGGLPLSVVLFLLFHVTFSPFVYWPQVVGIYVCMLLRGVHSASETDFALISIPTKCAYLRSRHIGDKQPGCPT